MSLRDIELAIGTVAARLPHLAHPRRICVEHLEAVSRTLGQYRWLSDTLRLNRRYLDELDEPRALDLLDTVIHELLHRHSTPWRQLRDTFRPHPDVHAEAGRLAGLLWPDYRRRREAA